MISGNSLLRNILLSRLKHLPYKMNFAVTNRCNSRCKTCNTWKYYKLHPEKKDKELKLSEVIKIFKNLPNTIGWMSLTGGEPFLRKDFSEILFSAIKYIPHLAFISIPTNGSVKEKIKDDITKILAVNHPSIYVTVSIDGPPDIHDKIRGVKGAFDLAWVTYTDLKNLAKNTKNFFVGLEVTISRFNTPHLYSFTKDLVEEGHRISFNLAHNAYLYKNPENTQKIISHKDSQIPTLLIDYIKKLNFFSSENIIKKLFYGLALSYLKDPTKMVLPCAALKASLAMDPYGNVYPCLMWDRAIGNLRESEYKLSNILSSYELKRTRHEIKNGKCPNCWTTCEALQTIEDNFLRAIFKYSLYSRYR